MDGRAQNILCIYVLIYRRKASPEFFSCVRTRRLLSRHTCPVRPPKSEMHARSWETFSLI